MNVPGVCGAFLLAQIAVGGTLQVRGHIDPDAASYLHIAAPGELSPDIGIRVLGPGEDRYSTCWPVKGALCELRMNDRPGKSKILIESDGYEPFEVNVPRLVFTEQSVTLFDIGTVHLKEAERPRLVRITSGDSVPGTYRWSLLLRNPARQPYSIRGLSLVMHKPHRFHGACDDRRSESYKFTQKLHATGGAGERKDTESAADTTGYLRIYNCGDQMLDIRAPLALSMPAELMTTIELETPQEFEVARPGVIFEPDNRPAEPLPVELSGFESFSFNLTSVRTDAAGQRVTEVLKREYSIPTPGPVQRQLPRPLRPRPRP